MKICGVVVLYNPSLEINQRILSYINKIDKLFVVDNSSDSNADILLKNDKIQYIPNMENLGIASALNLAARIAYEEGYDWILTMDQDSYFNGDNLANLVQYVCECDTELIGLVSPWHNTTENLEKPSASIEEKIDVMTSGNIVSLRAWKSIGGWKDWLFIDNVDVEFCMNLNVNGYKVLRLNTVELEHNLGNISFRRFLWKKTVCSNHNFIRQYYMVRNLYYIKKMYYSYFPDYINYRFRGMRGRLRNILLFEKDKWKKIRNTFRGYRDYKHNIKGVYSYKN